MKRAADRTLSTQGFTLVELGLVIGIAAFLIFTVGSVAKTRMDAERIKGTNQRLAIIMKAIEQYAKMYHHLPCPADPTLTPDNTNFGDGVGTGVGDGTSNPDPECSASNIQPAANGGTTDQVLRGAVPIKQLGLNPLVAIDGWDRKFTYAVSEAYTIKGSMTDNKGFMDFSPDHTPSNGTTGNIEIRTNLGTSVTTTAAVLVVSHGINGFGAFPRDSAVALPAGATTQEMSNSNDTTANSDPDDFYVSLPTATYDDIADYRMRWQLVTP